MTLSRRRFAGTMGAAALGITPLLRAFAQDALDAIPDGPLRNQVEWILGLLNDPDVEIVEDEVAEHFNEDFLAEVPAGQMVQIVESLRAELRGITVTGIEVAPDGHQAQVDVLGNTGVAVRMFVVVEPGSGLISGILFQPGEASARGEQATPVAATPMASPVVTAEAPPTTAEILADYQVAVEELTAVGRAVTDAVLSGDEETFRSMLSESAAGVLGDSSVQELMTELTEDIVSFSFAEVGAFFAGRFTGDEISGYFHQGTPAAFRLRAEEPQSGNAPTGLWTGDIIIGSFTLSIEVTFTGTAADLSASISIPEQGLFDHPLTDVRFDAERPIGALMDERALPMGPSMGTSSYGAVYEWGDMLLAINSGFDADNMVMGMTPIMQVPLPPDPAADVDVATMFRLPFDGAWMVIWGGESEFRNYHSPVPQQRYAHDIVIWRDGATYAGGGTRNEDYHCYGQPQYAPADGTIVTVVDEYPDATPGVVIDGDPGVHPAGNHIVIEVAEGEYVLMAHFIPGSIAVTEGDIVSTGDLVGLTGNSGNSSEPHIHIHMQTGPDMLDPSTVGLPMAFTNVLVNGEPVASARIEQGQIVEPA
jgi:hypothetical protein